MSNFVVYLARFAASDGSTGVIRLDRRVVVAELYCNGFLRARFAGLALRLRVCTEAKRAAFTSSVHTRVDRLPFPPLELLAYRQLVLAAHGKCLKADILPLNKKQVSDNVKKRKKAKKAGRAAAAQ
jgi:hypothetical protein